jgi:hypothetical protein
MKPFIVFINGLFLKPVGSNLNNPTTYQIPMKYTCTDYRTEMILVSLRQRLKQEDLNEAERKDILSQIEKVEAEMELD